MILNAKYIPYNIFSVDFQKIVAEERAKNLIAREKHERQRRQREIKRLQDQLSYHKQSCRCRFGICNGKLKAFSIP